MEPTAGGGRKGEMRKPRRGERKVTMQTPEGRPRFLPDTPQPLFLVSPYRRTRARSRNWRPMTVVIRPLSVHNRKGKRRCPEVHMRLASFCCFLFALVGISAAQDTNFPVGPQYLMTSCSPMFAQPI